MSMKASVRILTAATWLLAWNAWGGEDVAGATAAIVTSGVDAARLSAAGFGQEKPVADNRTEAGRAKNRRVELVKKS
jgi:hypothetical protein